MNPIAHAFVAPLTNPSAATQAVTQRALVRPAGQVATNPPATSPDASAGLGAMLVGAAVAIGVQYAIIYYAVRNGTRAASSSKR
jgi:hypothetical protein